MGLFDSLFGRAEKPISDPGHLRDELFATARAGDSRRLERLARTNRSAVLEHFRTWQRVPEAVRADPPALEGYVHCLIAIAQLFAEKLGSPELMAALSGPPQSNPLARWQATLRQARELMTALRHTQARALLTDDVTERQRLFREAVTLNGNLVAAASATLALRAK